MRQLMLGECRDKIRWIGRTYEEKEQQVTYFNWTGSGLEFEFMGNYLLAEFYAYSSIEYDGIPPEAPQRIIWPWIAVFLDDEEEPLRRVEISHEKETCLIFASERIETHKIKIIKLTENAKGKTGIRSIFMEGTLKALRPDAKDKKYLEFIGDSITCGFGNETTERDRFFYSGEENGWLSHAAVAARLLWADYSIISVSGITAGEGIGQVKWPLTPMNKIYPYTDRILEDLLGRKKPYTEWVFKRRTPDIIVINLGTNDSSLIAFEDDNARGEANFERNYCALIRTVRELNGPKPLIICALGPMDYYLYSNIEKAVHNYTLASEDNNIACFRYGKARLHEGFGACGHPSAATQIRMGTELADYIRSYYC